jgi:hypothetical protein
VTEGGTQTKDERALADRCLAIIRIIPNQTTLTLTVNANRGQAKSNLVSTEEVYRACASDDRISVVLQDGLYRYSPKETQ